MGLIELNEKEVTELKYMNYLGFKYIARNEIGTVWLFKEEPVRDKIANNITASHYDTWVIGKYPIKNHNLYGHVKIGKYDCITWDNGVWDIEEILNSIK